jgi:hypothetical protein
LAHIKHALSGSVRDGLNLNLRLCDDEEEVVGSQVCSKKKKDNPAGSQPGASTQVTGRWHDTVF